MTKHLFNSLSLIIFCFNFSFFAPRSYAVGLEDLSVLLPISVAKNIPTAKYFTKPYYDMVETSSETVGKGFTDASYEDFRVVGIRIDNCAMEAVSQPCSYQLRLISQPFVKYLGFDQAIHAFYTLSKEEFYKILSEIDKIRGNNKASNKLGINSFLQTQTPEIVNKYLNQYLKYATPKRLVQFTFMRTNGRALGNFWEFGVIKVTSDGPVHVRIPTIKKRLDTFFMEKNQFIQRELNPERAFELGGFSADGAPVATQINIFDLFTDYPVANQNVVKRILQIEDPKITNPTNVDCLSCHKAHSSRMAIAESNNDLKDSIDDFYIRSSYQKVSSPRYMQSQFNFRMFGYFHRYNENYEYEYVPSVMQRVVNETLNVLERR